jgi:hypothetical protein
MSDATSLQQIEQEESRSGARSSASNFSLAPEDRRLLLGASLRLLGRRFSCGKPILQSDVIRVVSLADDAVGLAA